MDKIYLHKMEFFAYHGVLPEEQKLGQRFIVDVILELDLKKAGQTDDLEETVNYADVYLLTKEIVEGKPYKLIESVAEDVAGAVLSNFTTVNQCTVTIIKPDPPIAGHYESVAVEIQRSRNE